MTTSIRSFIAAAVVVFTFAAPALAGPPLICHPFTTDGGGLIAWGTGPGWNTPDRGYDIKRLVADTTALLSADAPVITRMENIRRATIYAMRDPQVANQLLKSVIDRALATSTNGDGTRECGDGICRVTDDSGLHGLGASRQGAGSGQEGIASGEEPGDVGGFLLKQK